MNQNPEHNEPADANATTEDQTASPTPVEVVEEVPGDASETDILRLELDTKRERINELAKGIKNLQVDFDTRLKRIEREKERAVEQAKGQLLEKLVPVLDQFNLSVDAMKPVEANEGVLQGVQLIYKQFLEQLTELGLKQFDPLGQPFDPTAHEALSRMTVEDPAQNGRVVNVVRHGYRFQTRVLRPAQVLVGHHPNPTPEPEELETNEEEAPETDASSSS